MRRALLLVLGLLTCGANVTVAIATPGGSTGPSSSDSPYLVRLKPGVVLKSILTVGDAVPKARGEPGDVYRLVGKPDGLGAFDNGDGTFTLLMNHELGGGAGVVRAHGARGSFVSRWLIRKDDLSVVEGEDLIKRVATWNVSLSRHNAPTTGVTLRDLCSATLPPRSALYNEATGNGFDGRVFMGGEEVNNAGRAFGHLLDGTTYELPALGKAGWENQVAHADTGDSTVVVGLDDTTSGGQVYVYVGEKKAEGNPVERAGLTGGTLYGIKVAGYPTEPADTGIPSGRAFTGHSFGDVSARTGPQLNSASVAAGVTLFQRPEDGVWSTANPNDFYFATTAEFDGKSRLWRLHFEDPTDPAKGGTISMVLDGTESEGYHQLDNTTANERGRLILQEDPGGNARLARVWQYDLASDALEELAKADPARFRTPEPPFTQQEESSGVIDVSDLLGEGWYLLDFQAHYPNSDTELVEGGQLLAMHVPPGRPVDKP
jgi:hypothetical protein